MNRRVFFSILAAPVVVAFRTPVASDYAARFFAMGATAPLHGKQAIVSSGEFLALRELQAKEIARWFGIPPGLLNDGPTPHRFYG